MGSPSLLTKNPVLCAHCVSEACLRPLGYSVRNPVNGHAQVFKSIHSKSRFGCLQIKKIDWIRYDTLGIMILCLTSNTKWPFGWSLKQKIGHMEVDFNFEAWFGITIGYRNAFDVIFESFLSWDVGWEWSIIFYCFKDNSQATKIWDNPYLFSIIFQYLILRGNCRLQRDSKLEGQSWRQVRWPLAHLQDPPFQVILRSLTHKLMSLQLN